MVADLPMNVRLLVHQTSVAASVVLRGEGGRAVTLILGSSVVLKQN